MSDESGASAPATTLPPADQAEPLTIDQAFRLLNEEPEEQEAESAKPATAKEELSGEDNAAPPEEATGETKEETDPAAEPPLDLPRSWTKEQSETWSKLDRATQQYLLEHDRKTSEGVRRSQNELAETRKALEAELAQTKQAREKYETDHPALVKALETNLQNQFGDIQTMNDVRKMQAEDPFRFQQWQLHQMELAQAKANQQAIDQRTIAEKQAKWTSYTQEESKAFMDSTPEFASKAAEYTTKAAEVLKELGFSEAELNKFASGEEKIPLYDRRMQRLLFDRIKLSEIRAAPAKAMPKPVPPVAKPGTAAPRGAAQAESIKTLTQKLERSGSIEDALALLQARRSLN